MFSTRARLAGVAALAVAILAFLIVLRNRPQEEPSPYISGPIPFRHVVIDAEPAAGPDCCTDICATGDLSGDGYADIVIGAENASGPGLVWYEYPLWTRRPVGAGQFTTDGQTGDIDGDGDLDIIVSNHDLGICWYENPRGREMAATSAKGAASADRLWPEHLIGTGHGHDLEVGDVDDDGDLDVVTCDKHRWQLWQQVTPLQWRKRTLLTRNGEGTALADLDGDGDLDVVFGGGWLEAPADVGTDPWPKHVFHADWPAAARVAVADLNRDGRLDVALSASEGEGDLSWFAAPADPGRGEWTEHAIATVRLHGAHSLQVADLDSDGDFDVVTAEMHTSSRRRVLVYLNNDLQWSAFQLGDGGSHNLRVADIGGDGDLDIIGKNYAGTDKVVEMWENRTADLSLVPNVTAASPAAPRWTYLPIDTGRGTDQFKMMGLVTSDVNGDGAPDVIAGSCLYLNPGDVAAEWQRILLPDTVDVYFAPDVDDDGLADLVGCRKNALIWLEATDASAEFWLARRVATVPAKKTQGYVVAQITAGGKPELVFTRGYNLLYVEIPDHPDQPDQPDHPDAGEWPLVHIATDCEEEGVAVGDLDRDGDLDIVAVDRQGHHAVWYANPGLAGVDGPGDAVGASGVTSAGSATWQRHVIGPATGRLDRVGVADLNRDGRLDVVVSEESRDWHYNSRLYWFAGPADPLHDRWPRRIIATLRSLNSLGLADLDGDGSIDIVTAEHTDQRRDHVADDNLTLALYNRADGTDWELEIVEQGPHTSHLGARPCDLDGDGDLDLVSIAWQQYRSLHMWQNPR